ncbi:MAG: hypothetical protein ACK4K5_08260 [Thermosynechococcus sp.]|uniref:hypothetical protein n=1 Tax=Thermosynechococcus sp. TaxID=2814275 RepID=UPI00391C5CB3
MTLPKGGAVDLLTQVDELIANAPDDPATVAAVQAIAPVLYEEAQRYGQTVYYVLQTRDGQWQVITLEEQHPPHRQKNVIHAYGSQVMAQAACDEELIPVAMPIIPLLFQLLAADPVDSLILYEADGERGWEVARESLLAQVRAILSAPPDIA